MAVGGASICTGNGAEMVCLSFPFRLSALLGGSKVVLDVVPSSV